MEGFIGNLAPLRANRCMEPAKPGLERAVRVHQSAVERTPAPSQTGAALDRHCAAAALETLPAPTAASWQCFWTLSDQSAEKDSIFDNSSNACVLVCVTATCCQGLDAYCIQRPMISNVLPCHADRRQPIQGYTDARGALCKAGPA